MTSGADFAAQVSAEVDQFEGAAQAIFADSVTELVELAQRMVPVKTGFLVNSIEASNAAMPQIDPAKHGGGEVKAATISAEIINGGYGATLFVGYTASYAARINFGFHGEDSLGRKINQAGVQFVGRAAQQWPEIVARNEARIMGQLRAIK